MPSRIEAMSRDTAERLLHRLREAQAQGRLVDVLLYEGSDWEHPQTLERRDRAEALEGALERMLQSRAKHPSRGTSPGVGGRGFS